MIFLQKILDLMKQNAKMPLSPDNGGTQKKTCALGY